MTTDNGSVVRQAQRIRAAILARHGHESESSVPGADQPGPLETAASLATVSAHWGIVSSVPVVGRFVVLTKRALRIGLRWYINPIVEQQNAFNDAAVRSLYELQAENDKLRAEITALKHDRAQS